MQNIIYKSDSIIPWDTQSAFKMTSYNTCCEEHMVFCYLKTYVHRNDLVICSYCFTEHPRGNDNLHIYINPNPEKSRDYMKIDFGFDGIKSAVYGNVDFKDKITYRPFKADDEQGFYWCGEITVPAGVLHSLAGCVPEEKSIITMNMVQSFDNGDTSTLFGNRQQENYDPAGNMAVFVVLNY